MTTSTAKFERGAQVFYPQGHKGKTLFVRAIFQETLGDGNSELELSREDADRYNAGDTSIFVPEANVIAHVSAQSSITLPDPVKKSAEPKSLLTYALACVRRGWFVFPCYPRTKKPAGEVVPNGVLQASNDENQVREWWAKNPNYNPAIALGPSNLVIYDFDEIKPFESLPPTFTVRTGRLPKDGIEGIQMYYTGSTKTHGHPGGGGEVRSRGAYVMVPGAIHPSGNAYTIISNIPLASSPEQYEEVVAPTGPAIGPDKQETIAAYIEKAFDDAGVDYQSRGEYQGGFKWLIVCPWNKEHSEGNDFDTSTAVIMWPSGKLIYECKHKHCSGIRQWEQLRDWMQTKLGRVLAFGDPKDVLNLSAATVEEYRKEVKEAEATHEAEVTIATLEASPFALGEHLGLGGEDDAATIPAFDVEVANGIYKKIVDVVCKNTTLAPQYIYSIAKTLVGALIAGRIKFKEMSAEPRTFLSLIGETGAGKGESYRRTWAALNPRSYLQTIRIKVADSADSGAGIKDFFFEEPADQPMCIYIDEIASMGDKSSKTRNPDILNTIFELKDGTRVSRVKAGVSKTKNDARLVVIMCGQNKSVFSEALVGRTETGGYDRLTPEYGVPQETGDLPEISEADRVALRMAFEELVYANHNERDNTMSFEDEAKINLDEYWNTLPLPIRRKARWKQGLMVDCYLSAFGEGRMVVEQGDVDIATKIFERQLVIRQVFFGMTAPDRVGYYIRRIKDLLEKMMQLLKAGMPEEQVALSCVDFTTKTGAYKKNEEVWFKKAWGSCDQYVREIETKNSRGHKYKKYLPSPRAKSAW